MIRPTFGRRTLLAFAASLLVVRRARADVSVPPKLQAQLIGKIASFDRNFSARASGNAVVLIVQKPGDADSSRIAGAMASSLGELSDIGGVPKTIEVIPYAGASALATIAKTKKAAVLYLSLGLDGESKAIAGALAGGNVLTVGATGAFADAGANVGFDLEGSRPKIVVNLASSKAQNVALKAELLKLARVTGA